MRDELFGWPRDLPQQEERARLLREVSERVRKCGRWVTPGGDEVWQGQSGEGMVHALVGLATCPSSRRSGHGC